MQMVLDAHDAGLEVPTAALEAAGNADTAWAAVNQVKGLNYDERVKLLNQLAQRIALPSLLAPPQPLLVAFWVVLCCMLLSKQL